MSVLFVFMARKAVLVAMLPMGNGVVSRVAKLGPPDCPPNAVAALGGEKACALIVVPCGMDAMRTTLGLFSGLVVAGTFSHMPGSKWMSTGLARSPRPVTGLVTSWIVWRYGRPPRKMSPWLLRFRPRLGILPIVLPKVSCSVVRFSSRTLSFTPSDGVGIGKGVVSTFGRGRKIRLKPFPAKGP